MFRAINRRRRLLWLTLAMAVAVPAPSQSRRIRPNDPASAAAGDDQTIRLRTEEVLLPVTVQNRSGNLRATLNLEDLIVTEDDKPQRITSIARTSSNVLFVLDTSGDVSTLKNVNVHRELALLLIEALSDEDNGALMTYAAKVQTPVPWTHDRAAIKAALVSDFKPGGKSHLYEALSSAARLLEGTVGRRSVILLTDGVDSVAQGGFEKALEAIQRVRATVYVISDAGAILRRLKPQVTHGPSLKQRIDPIAMKVRAMLQQYVSELEAGTPALQRLAEETGGRLWDPEELIRCTNKSAPTEPGVMPDRFTDCYAIKKEVIEEIGSEYVIAYSTQRKRGDASFHEIRAYSKRTDLQVRTRKGIYSKDASDDAQKYERR